MDSSRSADRSEPVLTVAVPTFNRAPLLKQTLRSILAQEGVDFRVVVFDNASTDETESVVRECADPRLSMNRSPVNIGLVPNWNRCIRSNTSELLCLFHDDDLMLPGFLAASVDLLLAHPNVAFSFALAQLIDGNGNVLGPQRVMRDVPGGVMEGFDFLEQVVSRHGSTVYAPAVVCRASAFQAVGEFDSPHSKYIIDTHLWYLMARKFKVGYINRQLVAVRQHTGSVSHVLYGDNSVGHLGSIAERLDAVAYLLESPRAADQKYRAWLAERWLALHRRETTRAHHHIPDLHLSWDERVQLAKDDLARTIPPGGGFVLVDDGQWGFGQELDGRRVWPITERDGFYSGPPPEGTLIAELERLREAGAAFIAFAWTALWWLDHYDDLDSYLRQRRCLLCNSRLVIYSL